MASSGSGHPAAPDEHFVPLTFVVAGFSKCGTTSLTEMLADHPAVVFSDPLEPWFFSRDDYDDRWPEYRAKYPHDLAPFTAVGDDSTDYTSLRWGPAAAERLSRHYPDLRYLFVVRDPVARIESAFREFHHSGPKYGMDAPFTLGEAFRMWPELVADSCYWERLAPYRELVARDRMKVVHLEDVVRQPVQSVADIQAFLGLSTSEPVPRAVHRNSADQKLRDTRLLRRLRNTRRVGPALARVPAEQQDRYLRPLRLRRSFVDPVVWGPDERAQIVERVLPDARRLVAEFGAPAVGWRRLEEMAGQPLTPVDPLRGCS